MLNNFESASSAFKKYLLLIDKYCKYKKVV